MYRKSALILYFLFAITQVFSRGNDSLNTAPIRPNDGSFSTYLMISGLINSINIGMERDGNYLLSNANLQPVFNLKYQFKAAHQFGLKFSSSSNTSGTIRTDTLRFRSSVSASKLSHSIPLNFNKTYFMVDDAMQSSKQLLFIPFYEYHFKGNRRWDYYLGAEYVIKYNRAGSKKNYQTILLTANGEVIEYTATAKKNGMLAANGFIATGGVNFFIYEWLSVGTKVSFSSQMLNNTPFEFEEKLLVNGVDKTSTLLISNTSKVTNNKVTQNGFLGNGFAGIMVNFYL